MVNTRINILQWILTKLGTYLVLERIWNPIDVQGHMSKIKVKRLEKQITSERKKTNVPKQDSHNRLRACDLITHFQW
jgi:hypothetical protein